MALSWQRRTATLLQCQRPTSPQLSFLTVPQRCDNVNHVTVLLCQLETDSFDFLDQICSKRVFLVKTGKVNMTIEFWIFELVQVPNFTFKQTIFNSGTEFAQKENFCLKTEKVNNSWLSTYWHIQYYKVFQIAQQCL